MSLNRSSETNMTQDTTLHTDKEPDSKGHQGQQTENVQPAKTEITFSGALAAFLASNRISLAFTSYQSGRLYFIGSGNDGKLALHEAQYPQAMGVSGNADRLYLGTLTEIVRLENVLQPGQIANQIHDKVYVPRNRQVVGGIDIHELGIRQDGVIVFVNTRYSCLCQPSLTHSFKPIWKPDFITKLAPEDRCHLNGLAMKDGQPKYVTAICRSDVIDGWRDRRHDGGIIIDVESDKIVANGLSMPHSPRWYQDKLWVLNSGSGELGWIDIDNDGVFNPIAFCPGFLRGLSFYGQYAFVTLSKPRYNRFDGLALADRLDEKDADAWCGVQVIDLSSGDVVHWLRFDGAIAELFDVCALPAVQNALTIGPDSNDIRDFISMEPLPV